MLENRDQLMERDAAPMVSNINGTRVYYEYSYLRLLYTLKSGLKVERRYPVYYLKEEVDRPGTVVNALKEFYSSESVQYANLMGGMDGGRILSAELTYPARAVKYEEGYVSWEWDYKNLTSDQAEALVEAIRRDIAAGNFGRNAFDSERWQKETYAASIEIHYKPLEKNGQLADWNSYLSLKFSSNSTNLIAELERQGILKRTELYTEYQVYNSEQYGAITPSVIPESAIVYKDANGAIVYFSKVSKLLSTQLLTLGR